MSLRSILAAALCGLIALSPAACSVSSDPTAPAPAAAPSTAPDEAAPAPDEATAACDAETTRLQAAADGAHAKSTSAVLAVKTPSCGMRVITSGSASLTSTKLHRIGSVTKTYVSAVVLGLVHEAALSLEDPISKFELGVPNGDAITVHHLLDHTSGLFNYTEDAAFLDEALSTKKTYAPGDLVATSVKHDPYFAPGEGWHYSNTNYVLLGMIAEKVGKARIGTLVRQRVLDEVGLPATFFEGEEPIGGELAPGFSSSGKDITTAYGPSWSWAAGAMVASPADVATWIEALASGAFHDPTTQAAMMTTVPTGQGRVGYGLGIMVFDASITGGMGIGIGHAGDIPGYHTQAFHFPDRKTTLVVIVDSDDDDPNDVTAAALKVLAAKR